MKNKMIIAALLVSFLFLPALRFTAAAAPEVLPDAGCVVKGVLGNGLSYYLIQDASDAAVADFVLVKKYGGRPLKEALGSLYSFPDGSAARFLARAGAPLGASSYSETDGDAEVYTFKGVRLQDGAVADSAILLMANIASVCGEPFSGQALIVSGDIDQERILASISLLTMYEPYRKDTSATDSARDDVHAGIVPLSRGMSGDGGGEIVTVSMTFRRAFLPPELRNTVIVPVGRKMDIYAVSVLDRRLELAAEACGLDLLDHSVSVSDSADVDIFRAEISVSSSMAGDAGRMLENVFADAAAGGFSLEEYRAADFSFYGGVLDYCAGTVRESMTERAVGNFLYGTSLASPQDEWKYLSFRPLADTLGLSYLNRYVTAMLEPVLDGTSPDTSAVYDFPEADTSFLPAARRTASKGSKREYLSGASLLSFSNGLKVYYMENDEERAVTFSLFYRGGYSEDDAIGDGAGAFYSDIIKTDSIAGMDYRRFERMLEWYGISLEYDFALNYVEISGRCPVRSLGILWRALDALINHRSADNGAFEKYVRNERMRLVSSARNNIVADTLDALVHPFSYYSPMKRLDALERLDYGRIREFISRKLKQTGNMVLAFMSPLSEEGFRDCCREYSGWYERKKPVRHGNYDNILNTFSGNVTSSLPAGGMSAGEGGRLDLLYAIPCDYASKNYYLAKTVEKLVKPVIDQALADFGTSSETGVYFGYPPDDYCYVHIMVFLPEGLEPAYAAHEIKSVLRDLRNPSAEAVERAGCLVKNETESFYASAAAWFALIKDRYVFNKNMYSHYGKDISGITAEDAGAFVGKMLKSGCVEVYVLN